MDAEPPNIFVIERGLLRAPGTLITLLQSVLTWRVTVAIPVTKLKPRRLASETIMTGLWARLLFCIRAERTARCWGRWSERLVYLKGIRLVGG